MEKNITTPSEFFDYSIEQNIAVAYELAANFGEDIPQAFSRLAHKLNTTENPRRCFGLITHVAGQLLYMACIELHYPDEAEKKNVPATFIPLGDYLALKIDNWSQNLTHIGPAFDRLIYSGLVDKDAPSVEYYLSERELYCMMLKKNQAPDLLSSSNLV